MATRALLSDDATRSALAACLDVLLRMIPQYCEQATARPCLDSEHDAAIAEAAAVLYGADVNKWPDGVRRAARGEYP